MVNFGGSNPYLNNLFTQLAFPQAALLNAATQIPNFALPALHTAYSSAMGPASLLQGAAIPPFLAMPSPASQPWASRAASIAAARRSTGAVACTARAVSDIIGSFPDEKQPV